jgi:hypothetical protein
LNGTIIWGPTFFASASPLAGEPDSKKYQDGICQTGPASAPTFQVIGRFYLGNVIGVRMPHSTFQNDNWGLLGYDLIRGN